MRYFLIMIAALLPLNCPAEEEAASEPPAAAAAAPAPATNGVQIIDGKKFFPLSGARRQLNTDLSPQALAIMNHPRADTRITPAFRAQFNPRLASHEAPAAGSSSPPASNDEAILSIFTPDDRSLRSMPSNSSSPIRK